MQRFQKTESNMVAVVQLVRASDCGSECRRFESDQPPTKNRSLKDFGFLLSLNPATSPAHDLGAYLFYYRKFSFKHKKSVPWHAFLCL